MTTSPGTWAPPARLTGRAALTQRQPWLLPVAVLAHRARRRVRWWRDAASGRVRWTARREAPLPVVVRQHASPLRRQLAPDQMHLQQGKITNLTLAAGRVDALVIEPGETFSFNRVVGNCTRRKGFQEGMRLAAGRPVSGVGGGICQMANLIHWLVLHTPLTVVQRSDHSFDAFPDNERVVPWGVGCTIVYNYVDLVVRNDTNQRFQLCVRVEADDLVGEIRSDTALPYIHRVEARDEGFRLHDGTVYRHNEIWRVSLDPATSAPLREEMLKENCARVIYDVDPGLIGE